MSSDDLQGQYLKVRNNAHLTPAQQLRARQAQEVKVKEDDSRPFSAMPVIDFAADVAADIGGGIIEAPRQVVGGVLDATKELAQFMESVIPLGTLGGDEVTEESFITADAARTTTGGLVRGVSQFLTGFVPAMKGLKAAGAATTGAKGVGTAMGAGAATDALVFDPHEDRLSNLVEQYPELSNPVTSYLAADPTDSDAEGRFKNALEGLGLGAMADGLFAAAKGIRAARVQRLEADKLASEKAQIDKLAEVDTGSLKADIDAAQAEYDKKLKDIRARAKADPESKASYMDEMREARKPLDALKSQLTIQEQKAKPKVGGESGAFVRPEGKPFKAKAYHQTDQDFAAFDTEKTADGTVWFTQDKANFDDPASSASAASGKGRVIESEVELRNAADADLLDKYSVGELVDMGFDGAVIDGDVQVFDLAAIRSIDGVEQPPRPEPEAPKQLPIKDESIEGDFIPFQEKLGTKDEPTFKVGSKKADAERAVNINLRNIDTTEEVEATIDGMARRYADDINEARREVITQEETAKLADDLGMTVDDLLSRRRGQAFNAEQAVAARRLLVASGEKLVELAKVAKAGGDEDVVAFRRALAQHNAIQSQVSGLTAEAGRALQSFNIQAKSAKQQERMIREALDAGGGIDNSRKMAEMVSAMDEPGQINAVAKDLQKANKKEMFYEAWINGLLSSPATHAVNILSNSIVAGWSVGERKVANLIGGVLDIESVPRGEASAQAWGLVNGAKDGFRLAWQAFKSGEPSDVLTKIEVEEHKAITADNLGLSGTPGMFADFVGTVARLPGRFLTAEDEFFKSIGYRMELHAQAFRTASHEGLEGDAMASRIVDIMNNPPENIELEAINAMRYQTFTRELGETGKSIQGMVSKVDKWTMDTIHTPSARVIVPFIKTPTNIVKYVAERTPLAPLSADIRAEIAAGGARRDLALAKIATGSMAMAAAADYALSGHITGGGSQNPDMRRMQMATGWQPYSIKVGDTYVSYSRLDPIGAFIGLSADAAEVMGQVSDADAMDLAIAGSVAVAQNVTSKTYLSGVSQFFDVMSSTSADPDANHLKMKRFIERMAGSVVPAGVAQVERVIDPTLSATDGVFQKIRSRIPGMSADLPPRRNIFGEPIILEGGIGPDIMSPLYTSTDKKDSIADEIVKQQTRVSMPRNSINGIKLSVNQYDRYIKFYAGENNPYVEMPLRDKLRETFNSDLYKGATSGAEGGKSMVIKAIFDSYKQAAQQAMKDSDPSLMMGIQTNIQDRAIKLGAGL